MSTRTSPIIRFSADPGELRLNVADTRVDGRRRPQYRSRSWPSLRLPAHRRECEVENVPTVQRLPSGSRRSNWWMPSGTASASWERP